MLFDGLWDKLKDLLWSTPKSLRSGRERSSKTTQVTTQDDDQSILPSSLKVELTHTSESTSVAPTASLRSHSDQQIVFGQSASPSTQEKPQRSETLDLIIGLDFGTAATKVVVRSPWLPGQRARAITFAELGHASSSYLLPTRLRVGEDGSFHLGVSQSGVWATDLKIALLDRAESKEKGTKSDHALIMATAYLALVLKEVRQRFLAVEQEIYRRFQIRWAVNMGFPSDGCDDKSMRDEFLLVARVAWQLSWQDGSITSNQVADLLRLAQEKPGDSELPVAVVPEVVAQAVGYARSPMRDTGLHLLVDVGASTLDVCGFVLRDADGQDCYDLLTTTVDRLGVLELHRKRLAALRCERRNKRPKDFDPLRPLPETLSEYHPGCHCGATDVGPEMGIKVARVLTRHLATLKKQRDHYSEKWQTGLPLFLCGGGGMMRFFQAASRRADEEFRKVMIAAPVRLRTLPKPEGLVNRDIDDGLFHRLSVAYGLSFDTFNIGSVTPPGDMEDIKIDVSTRDYEGKYISKDQV